MPGKSTRTPKKLESESKFLPYDEVKARLQAGDTLTYLSLSGGFEFPNGDRASTDTVRELRRKKWAVSGGRTTVVGTTPDREAEKAGKLAARQEENLNERLKLYYGYLKAAEVEGEEKALVVLHQLLQRAQGMILTDPVMDWERNNPLYDDDD